MLAMVHEEVLSLAAQDKLVNLLGIVIEPGLKTFPTLSHPRNHKHVS